jgi:hypothetical protein
VNIAEIQTFIKELREQACAIRRDRFGDDWSASIIDQAADKFQEIIDEKQRAS